MFAKKQECIKREKGWICLGIHMYTQQKYTHLLCDEYIYWQWSELKSTETEYISSNIHTHKLTC